MESHGTLKIMLILTVFVLISCFPPTYKYWSTDSRLTIRENNIHELLISNHNFSMTIAVSAIKYSGERRVGFKLTFLNESIDTAKIDFRRIEIVADGQVLQLGNFYLCQSNRAIPDSVSYVLVEPMQSARIDVGADHHKEKGVPQHVELQMEDVVSIDDRYLEFNKQPFIFNLLSPY